VHDGLNPVHRGFDPVTGGQVTTHKPEAVLGLLAAPAEYPHVASSIPQALDDVASERTGAAGNQDGCCHHSS
jgi:hypothetical protein